MLSYYIPIILLVVLIEPHTVTSEELTEDSLTSLVSEVRGKDHRLFRWDATRHTASRQDEDSQCVRLRDAFETIKSRTNDRVKGMACDFATFCITDHPENRNVLTEFAGHPGVHWDIVELVKKHSSYVNSRAAHLIYIAAFANERNHQEFVRERAVSALASMVKSPNSKAVQLMWGAAALQNLAASYCDTEDGRCYWEWPEDENIKNVVLGEGQTIISDGSQVRKEMAQDSALVERLVELACRGPVSGPQTEENPYPGENTIFGKHDDSPNIVAWAAAGALKNLALEPSSKKLIEPGITCLCRLAQSPDWLEAAKGADAVRHLRRYDPCWVGEDGDLCVDHLYEDIDGRDCGAYTDPSEEDCKKQNKRRVTPGHACCACGGGYREEDAHDEL